MKPLLQKYAMGSDWLAGPVFCDSLNRQCASKRQWHVVRCCIVNNDVVNIAYQFEAEWDAEDISEEGRTEPVQAQLLMVCFLFVVVSYF